MPTASPRVRRSTSTRTPRRRIPRSTFSAVEDAVEAIRRGGMVIVVDDEDRENEGDLTIAAEKVTAKAINFMMTHGRGLICMPMTPDRLDELEVPLQVPATRNTTPFDTAFCVGIEARRGVSTGISAGDRATTILTAINPKTRPMDLARPGHVFPLRARDGGVLVRAGQTEAAVDLARAAGLYPAGVICEIAKADGSMARVPDLMKFARRHQLPIITVADLIQYRMRMERLVTRAAHAPAADPARPVPHPRLRERAQQGGARRAGLRRDRRRRRRPGAGPFELPDRRRLPFGALRLRLAARGGDAAHRQGRARRAALPQSGGARHRPGQQDSRLRAPGRRARHRRGQRAARLQARPARLRHRRPDPARSGRAGRCGC